ncbi:MAG: sugar nucleotide-binding protein [Parvularculaceae bacterium]
MRVLLFGANGQVGVEVQRSANAVGAEVFVVDRALCDLTRDGAPSRFIEATNPDVVINAAAYTAVDKAESDEETAQAVNAAAPGEMAMACAELGLPFVHFRQTMYSMAREPALSRNGYARAARRIRAHETRRRESRHRCGRCSRDSSALMGFSAHGAGVKTMLRYGAERDVMRVVADQRGESRRLPRRRRPRRWSSRAR